MAEYADRDVIQLDRDGGYYCRHVSAMTAEGLHSKADIAAELAWRDREIARLKANHPQPVTPAGGECDACGGSGYTVRPSGSTACWKCSDKAPAGGEVVEVYSKHDGVATFDCPDSIKVGDKLYTHPPVADAALVRDAERYRWWREHIDALDGQSLYELAYACQVQMHNGHIPAGELMDMIADSQSKDGGQCQ